MLAAQGGQRPALVQEALYDRGLTGQGFAQELDGHGLFELRVPSEAHDPHAAFGKDPLH